MTIQKRIHSRGITSMIAVGTVAVFSMAVLIGFSASRSDAETQAASRYQRQAFFAAEAGLAEARARLTAVVGGTGNFTPAMVAGNVTTDLGAGNVSTPSVNNIWFDVLGGSQSNQCLVANGTWCQVSLSYSSSEITNMGFNNRAGALPAPVNVMYRVFLRDDSDETASDYTVDVNGVARIISVGEVQRSNGTVVARQAIIAYVRAASASSTNPNGYSQGQGSETKTNGNSSDLNPVQLAQGTAGFN